MDATAEVSPVRYQIDDLVLDTGLRSVTRGTEKLKLGALTFDFLLALAESAPSMVTYDQLARQVWNGRRVSPETIAQRAAMLRTALSDDAKSPRYFELIRGQGYRLVANVASVPGNQEIPQPRRWIIAAATIVVISALLLVAASMLQSDDPPMSVAVLPFADLSEKGDQQYFADGIAEELINELTGLQGLEVASRTESFFFREPTNDLQKVGRQLGVNAVVEGSIRKSENHVRVTVQLIEVASGYHLWSGTFDRELQDIFAIQEDIAASVTGALGVKLGVGGINEFHGAGTESFQAYEAFLQGDFETAIELDPEYAEAWARFGLSTASTMWLNAPEDAPAIIERALQYVSKALDLNPQSARAHLDFATVNYATMDWILSEEFFAKALALNRNESSVAHYANMLMRAGRSSDAIARHEERDSLLRIDDVAWYMLRFNPYIALGRFDVIKPKTMQLPDEWPRSMNLLIALNETSVATLREALEAIEHNSIEYRELYGPLLQVLNQPDDAVALLRELASDPSRAWPSKYHDIALLAAYFGEPEFAFEIFARELRNTTIRYYAIWYPVMSEVRQLPEFKEFVADVNLVDYWRTYGWSDFCRPLGADDFVCE